MPGHYTTALRGSKALPQRGPIPRRGFAGARIQGVNGSAIGSPPDGPVTFGVQEEPPIEGQRLYIPYGAARALWTDKSPEVILDGPAGTGKSRGALEKVNALAIKYPASRGLILRKTLRSIRQSAMVTFETKVLPASAPIFFHGGDFEYRYPNGSVVVVGGLDRASKVMSTEYDYAYIMEATELTEDDYEAVTTRLRNGAMPYQQLFGDCNPSAPSHWLKKRADRGSLKMIASRHEDNPRLWDRGKGEWTEEGRRYIAILDALTGVRKERLRFGRWVGAEGVVFDAFDRRRNVVDRYDLPAAWTRIRVIDFGYANSFVCQWWAIHPATRQLILYRELVGVRRLVSEWARLIKQYSLGENILMTVTDHDAEGRATLEAELGISTVPAVKKVTAGIDAVNQRLKPIGGEGSPPGLVVFSDALMWRDQELEERKKPIGVLEEIDTYVYQKSGGGTILKEQPVKEDDHSMDTMRYAVMAVDNPRGDIVSDAVEQIREAFSY